MRKILPEGTVPVLGIIALVGAFNFVSYNQGRLDGRIDEAFERNLGTNTLESLNAELAPVYDSYSWKSLPTNMLDIPKFAKVRYLDNRNIKVEGMGPDFP